MQGAFDPYYRWLGIPPKDQPPNHYRLLGIEPFEPDANVIETAADRQMGHVRRYQRGEHSAESQKLLGELAAARICLLNPEKRAAYDRQLEAELAKAEGPAQDTPEAPAKSLVKAPPPLPAREAASQEAGAPAVNWRRAALPVGVAAAGIALVAIVVAIQSEEGEPQDGPPAAAQNDPGGLPPPAAPPSALPRTGGEPRTPVVGSGGTSSSGGESGGESAPGQLVPRPTIGTEPWTAGPDPPDAPVTMPNLVRDDERGGHLLTPARVAGDTIFTPNLAPSSPARSERWTPCVDPPSGYSTLSPPRGGGRSRSGGSSGSTGSSVAPPVKKAAVPNDATCQAVLKELREIFKEEYAAANRAQGREALAEKLRVRSLGLKADEPAHYVMLREALDYAVDAGDVLTADDVLERLADDYEVDVLSLRAKALMDLTRTVRDRSGRSSLLEKLGEACGMALVEDRYDEAEQMALKAMYVAGRNNHENERQTAEMWRDRIRMLRRYWEQSKPAFDTLKTSPDDPAANLAVGLFYCGVKYDWEKGCPHLAKCGESALQIPAQLEIDAGGGQIAPIRLADAWWDAATARPPADRGPMLLRARHWYLRATAVETGLNRVKAQKRLNEIPVPGMFPGKW